MVQKLMRLVFTLPATRASEVFVGGVKGGVYVRYSLCVYFCFSCFYV